MKLSKKKKKKNYQREKIFANHISEKELISKTYKELIQLNNKTENESD